MLQVITVKTDGTIETVKIDNTLKTMQNLVKGYLQRLPMPAFRHDLYVNEDGKSLNLPENKIATLLCHYGRFIQPDDSIVGDVFITGPIVNEESTDASASMQEFMDWASLFSRELRNVDRLLNWLHIVSAVSTMPPGLAIPEQPQPCVRRSAEIKLVTDPILVTRHQLQRKLIPSRLEVEPPIWYKPIQMSKN